MSTSQPPQQIAIAVYITSHGFGHLTRTLNLLSLLPPQYKFHIRTGTNFPSASHKYTPLDYPLHSNVIQLNAYSLSPQQSFQSLLDFDHNTARERELDFISRYDIKAILSDAVALPCDLGLPAILVTNFTFDLVYQALLDANPPDDPERATLIQHEINTLTSQYSKASSVIRLPGYVHFPFSGPKIIDSPMHFRKAGRDRNATLSALGLQEHADKKILIHSFGGQTQDASQDYPDLPPGWICLSQSLDKAPLFYKIPPEFYFPDLIAASNAILGKLGWGTCSEAIGNGYKPFIYVPRTAFIEESGLIPWMHTEHRRLVKLDVSDYESLNWSPAILAADLLSSEKHSEYVQEDISKVVVDELSRVLNL